MKFYFIPFLILASAFSGIRHTMSYNYPEHLQKKINRILKKQFKGEIVNMQPIDLDQMDLNTDITAITNDQNNLLGYGIIHLNNGCKLGGCMELESYDPNESYETFYCMTIYSPGLEIEVVHVLEYGSRYGYEITAASWLKQFKGKKGGTLKLNKDIDAISGATISAHAVVRMINDQQALIRSLIK